MHTEDDACATAVGGAVREFRSREINVEECVVDYRNNSHGEPSMFVVVHLTSPDEANGWPMEAVYQLRDAITQATSDAACDIPVYMQIEEAARPVLVVSARCGFSV